MNRTQAALAMLDRLRHADQRSAHAWPGGIDSYWRHQIEAVLAMPETDQERLARECQEMLEQAQRENG